MASGRQRQNSRYPQQIWVRFNLRRDDMLIETMLQVISYPIPEDGIHHPHEQLTSL
jgi:hypothetical protein